MYGGKRHNIWLQWNRSWVSSTIMVLLTVIISSIAGTAVPFGLGPAMLLFVGLLLSLGLKPTTLVLALLMSGAFDLQYLFGPFYVFGNIGVFGEGLSAFGLLFLIVCLIGLIRQRVSITIRKVLQIRFVQVYVVFLVFSMISVTYSRASSTGIRLAAELAYPLLFYMLMLVTPLDVDFVQKFLIRLGIVTLAVVLIGLGLGYTRIIQTGEGVLRISGTMGKNPFAFFLATIALIVYGRLSKSKKGLRVQYTITIAILMLGIFLTGTRIALIGFTLGVIVQALLMKRLKDLMVIPLLIIFVILLIPAQFNRIFRPTIQGIGLHSVMSGEVWDNLLLNTWYGRLGQWQHIWKYYFLSNPLRGTGLGTTSHIFETAGAPHNEYLRLLAETGIVGFVLFVVAFLLLMLDTFRSYLRASNPTNVRIAATAMSTLILYLVVAVTDIPFNYYYQFGQYVFGLAALAHKTLYA